MPNSKHGDTPSEHEPDEHLYRMTLNLNLLNHLGINLYSNIPAVLSETVANSWDADAEEVRIAIYPKDDKIVITDSGTGMTPEQVNERYLNVGYQRREQQKDGRITERLKRPVMGRKGIGKLSLFSIANKIEVHTVRDNRPSAFLMETKKIEAAIKSKSRDSDYHPDPLDTDRVDFEKGTRIILSGLKKNISQLEKHLKKRISRRFSVIGSKYKFQVYINGNEIGIDDRDYFHKLQFVWWYGNSKDRYEDHCTKVSGEDSQTRDNAIRIGDDVYLVNGWIGTVALPSDLKDDNENLNDIALLVRGKIAQESTLDEFNDGRIFTKYIIGELSADFLDDDDKDDIATSSRQRIIEDDVRYLELRNFIKTELNHIASEWDDKRKRDGVKAVLEFPSVRSWFQSLEKPEKKLATTLFGKINQISTDKLSERRTLIQHSILAFESLRYKDELDRLEEIAELDFTQFSNIFTELRDIEATLYYRIVKERIAAIGALQKRVDEDALEKVLQDLLFDNLWLLDPSWERATELTPFKEKTLKKAYEVKGDCNLTEKQVKGRIDIGVRFTSGRHVIVELKRPGRGVTVGELVDQCQKYYFGTKKVLRKLNDANADAVNTVIVLGELPEGWDNIEQRVAGEKQLSELGAKVTTFQELLQQANLQYHDYLKAHEDVSGRVESLIKKLDTEVPTEPNPDSIAQVK